MEINNNLDALKVAPDIKAPSLTNVNPNIVGGMAVADSTNIAKPFMDMQTAIMDARIKQEALSQQKAQNEKSNALAEARLAQDQLQFDQTYKLDQMKMQQQAEQAMITQKIQQERLLMDQTKQQMETVDWTQKQNATNVLNTLMQQDPNIINDAFVNPDKYDPETIGKIKSALMVSDPKSYYSFTFDTFKENNKQKLAQKEAAALISAVPMMSEATAKGLDLINSGKSFSEATKPILEVLKKQVSDGVITVETAKALSNTALKNIQEINKQKRKMSGGGSSGGQTWSTHDLSGKLLTNPADIAAAVSSGNYYQQSNTGSIKKVAQKEKSALAELLGE